MSVKKKKKTFIKIFNNIGIKLSTKSMNKNHQIIYVYI